jgi:hypothetical protein
VRTPVNAPYSSTRTTPKAREGVERTRIRERYELAAELKDRGQETVPLDKALGLAARSTHSLEVQERCLLLATEIS